MGEDDEIDKMIEDEIKEESESDEKEIKEETEPEEDGEQKKKNIRKKLVLLVT